MTVHDLRRLLTRAAAVTIERITSLAARTRTPRFGMRDRTPGGPRRARGPETGALSPEQPAAASVRGDAAGHRARAGPQADAECHLGSARDLRVVGGRFPPLCHGASADRLT